MADVNKSIVKLDIETKTSFKSDSNIDEIAFLIKLYIRWMVSLSDVIKLNDNK